MQHFHIRPAIEKDFNAVLDLIKGLAVFQGKPEKMLNTLELMKAEQQYFGCFIAENEAKEIVGMTVYSFVYHTWVGKSIYLDDLYVKEAYRGQKIGSDLLKAVFAVAQKENCKKVRWLVSNWNIPAIEFYKTFGVKFFKEEWICDFDGEAILNFSV
ncbi:MAG: GNAT family N-acetyltransferase [Chitinophagales bacterium]